MHLTRILAVAASTLCIGCGHEPTGSGIAESLRGTWAMQVTVPGSSFSTTLAPSGFNLSGTGEFLMEAGLGGRSTVEGSVHGGIVDLDFLLLREVPAGLMLNREHFTGRLIMGKLSGTMQDSDHPEIPPSPSTFVRQE
jgi:hypothetical protein